MLKTKTISFDGEKKKKNVLWGHEKYSVIYFILLLR